MMLIQLTVFPGTGLSDLSQVLVKCSHATLPHCSEFSRQSPPEQICSKQHIHFLEMTQHKVLLPYTLAYFQQSSNLPTVPQFFTRDWHNHQEGPKCHRVTCQWLNTGVPCMGPVVGYDKVIQPNSYACLPNWNFVLTHSHVAPEQSRIF